MKVPFTVSIEKEDFDVLKRMCEVMGITQSKLMESAIRGYVLAAKGSGILKRKKATGADLVRFFAAGSVQDPLN